MSASDRRAVLYAADVSVLSEPQLYAAAYTAVSPARREKTDRYYFAQDRYLSLGAELLLYHALREAEINAFPEDCFLGVHGSRI